MSGQPSEFEQLWQDITISGQTVVTRGDLTLPTSARLPGRGPHEADALDTVRLRPLRIGHGEDVDLDEGDKLAQGGMGLVHRARQVSLDREVVLKRLRPDRRHPRDVAKLLLEARLTGALEHPNIVPSHELGVDSEGAPVLVMKRIRGRVWRAVLREDHALADETGLDDRTLAKHLRILGQVCNAIHYAHSRRVLHRDIKPDNVMVGDYGEVYVLDWGIALRLDANGEYKPPLGSDLEGTPAYMAPEMVNAIQRKPLDARTDVYLLGATLVEILKGRPPHRGDGLHRVLRQAYVSAPVEFEDHHPQELQALCWSAMSPDRHRRPTSADAFHSALKDYLDHRSATQLAQQAVERLDTMRDLAQADDDDLDMERLDALFNECRFGLTQSLDMWPSNRVAREQLDDALELMADIELRHQDPRAARRCLEAMFRSPPDDLYQRLREIERSADLNTQRMEVLASQVREHNVEVRAHVRGRILSRGSFAILVINALLLTLMPEGWSTPNHLAMTLQEVAYFLLFLSVAWVQRRLVANTLINRRMVLFFVCAMALLVMGHISSWTRGVPPHITALTSVQFSLAATAAAGMLVDPAILIAAGVQALSIAIGTFWPSSVLILHWLTLPLSLIVLGVIWERQATKRYAERLRSGEQTTVPM